MITVELNQIDKKNTYQINGKAVTLFWSNEKQEELYEFVNKLYFSLVNFDTLQFSSLFKAKEASLRTILNQSFKNEFNSYLSYVLENFFMENRVIISLTNLYRFLKIGKTENIEKASRSINIPDYVFKGALLYAIDNYTNRLKKDIHYALNNKDKETVWKISGVFTKEDFFKMCLVNPDVELDSYVLYCAKDFIKKKYILNGWTTLLNYAYFGKMERHFLPPTLVNILSENNVFKKIASDIYCEQLKECKTWKYDFLSDVWTIYYKEIQSIKMINYDFAQFDGNVKYEVKKYVEALFKTRDSYKLIRQRLLCIRTFFNEFNTLRYKEIYSVLDLNYLHIQHLFAHFQTLKQDDGSDRYHLSTIRRHFTEMKLFYNWLVNEFYHKDQANPFEKVTFNNVAAFSENIKYIPEEVVEAMQDKIFELPDHIQNIWIIMMHTGLRISDVIALEEDSLTYDNQNNLWVLSYIPIKNKNKRKDSGEGLYHKIPVLEVVAEAVNKQKEMTVEFRKEGKTNKIFITKKYNAITQYNPQWMAELINNLIQKYEIRDNSGQIYHYSHHQCRKTVAVEMFSNGSSIEEVADYLGQVEKTAGTYYKDIKLTKIMELETQFFEKMFAQKIDPFIRDAYSPEEKKSLIEEFALGSRETPEGNGTCVKHISFGPCHKRTCVGCKMLVTGPQKLPKWHQLYREQRDYLKEMENDYINKGINNFADYREYQREKHLLGLYKGTIIQTEKFANKEGIQYEKFDFNR